MLTENAHLRNRSLLGVRSKAPVEVNQEAKKPIPANPSRRRHRRAGSFHSQSLGVVKPRLALNLFIGGWCGSQWAGDALLSNQQEVNQGSSGIASRQRQCVGCTRSAKCFLAHGKTSPNGHHGTDAGAWREIVHRFWQG